jgi:hypothetical protein
MNLIKYANQNCLISNIVQKIKMLLESCFIIQLHSVSFISFQNKTLNNYVSHNIIENIICNS